MVKLKFDQVYVVTANSNILLKVKMNLHKVNVVMFKQISLKNCILDFCHLVKELPSMNCLHSLFKINVLFLNSELLIGFSTVTSFYIDI